MITITNITEDDYFMPEDGSIAKQRFLDMLSMPTKGYISCYGFTLIEAFNTIKQQDSQGIEYSLLLDYMQGSGSTEKPRIKDLYANMQHGEITLTCAGNKSKKTRQIWHWKGMVKISNDGGPPYCMEGSTNLSESGFLQGNSMRFFRNQEWADVFISQHEANKEWAIKTLPHYKPSILSDGYDFIDAYFDRK